MRLPGESIATMSPLSRALRLATRVALCAPFLCVTPSTAQVDTGPPAGGLRPDRGLPGDLVPAPEPDVPEVPLPVPTPREAPVPDERDLRGVRIFVREFRFVGNTVFSSEALDAIAAPYRGRQITSDELDELRLLLTRYYVDRGYINSGAVIPDQKVDGDVITIQLVEGRLGELTIEGTESLKPEFVSERLELGAGPPLNVNELQSRLQLLLQTPFIDRINADIKPGLRPGEADLVARVEEREPYRLALVVDNDISPSIGSVRGRALGELHNLTGAGDLLRTEIAFSGGAKDFFAQYLRPLNAKDTTLNVFGEKITSDVIEEPFDLIDVESENWSVGIGLTHPFYRTPRRELLLGVNFERRHSETSLLGRPFQSAPGVEPSGESNVTVLRFVQSWLDRAPNQVLAARSTVSVGIDALGATIQDSGPDGEFLSWLAQLQWAHRFPGDGGQLIVRGDLQRANGPLLPLEQFGVGGITSVRGYRKNLLVRDWGYAASVEYRYPFLRDDTGRVLLQVAAFVDTGGAWFINRPSPDPRSLYSVGLGLQLDPHPKVHAELYWGIATKDVITPEHDIQDSGLHFVISADLFN
jgi:hemolysin activation/secretion protein